MQVAAAGTVAQALQVSRWQRSNYSDDFVTENGSKNLTGKLMFSCRVDTRQNGNL